MKDKKYFIQNIKSLISFELILLFVKKVYQKARENDIFIHSMGMVYITTLSIVPFLIFSFYIMTLFNFFGRLDILIEEIKNLILNNLAPASGQNLINYIEVYILNVDIEQLGIISFVSLIFIIVFMLARVEMTFNNIWNIREHRDLLKRFISFWTFITLGTFSITLLLALSLLFTERYLGLWLSGEEISQSSLFNYFLFSFNFLIFITFYYFVPNTKVKPESALFAGLFSGTLFIIVKRLYKIYTANIITYNQIYGPISLIPIFLLWLYVIWLIVLLGAVVSYVFQNRADLKYILNKNEITKALRDLIPTAIMIALFKNYQAKNTEALSFLKLTEKINLPAADIKKELIRLKKDNIIAKTEKGNYLPLLRAENTLIWDLYKSKFLSKDFPIDHIFKDVEMRKLYQKIQENKKENFKKINFSDIMS